MSIRKARPCIQGTKVADPHDWQVRGQVIQGDDLALLAPGLVTYVEFTVLCACVLVLGGLSEQRHRRDTAET
jgi:hypothetical protein